MNRLAGAEKVLGIGGGNVVSEESLRNLNIGDDLARQRRPYEAVPYIRKALQDPNNLDAFISAAFLQPLSESMKILAEGARQGRRLMKEQLGPNALDDNGPHVGNYGNIMVARPYMRVLQAQVRICFEAKNYQGSLNAMLEMLRLDPNDRMNQSSWIGAVLNRLGRDADALYHSQCWLNHRDDHPTPERGGTAFKAPARGPIDAASEERNSRYATAVIYTAALSAFRLWGDCEEARSYIKSAAKANPGVLVKVMGRRSRPESLNMNPRGWNSPEDAHDYLWLSQDLWMEQKTWDWLDNNAELKPLVLKQCSRDGCPVQESEAASFQRCSQCHQVSYCGRECQKLDWKNHKEDCELAKQVKAISKAMQAGKALPADNTIPVVATDFTPGGVFMNDGKDPVFPKKKSNKKKKKKGGK